MFGMDRHAGEVGADLGAFAGMRMALSALILVHRFAGNRVALLFGERLQIGENFLAVGVGEAAAGFEQAAGAAGNSSIRVICQCLLLVEREVRKLQLAALYG